MTRQVGETLVLDGAVGSGVPEEAVRGPWPEIRIARMADIQVPAEAAQWGDFLNRFGRANYGLGDARALGSVGITYISAVNMGRMLEKKFPKVYESRRKTQQLHKRIGESYNSFVRECGDRERLQVIEEELAATVERPEASNADESEIYLRRTTSAIERRISRGGVWLPASVVTKELVPVGRNKVAFGFPDEESLYREYASTLDFLGQEGLDISRLLGEPDLHATIFRKFDHVGGHTVYRLPKADRGGDVHPASMRFTPPAARWIT